MPSFSCVFCNYVTKRKNDFNKHLNTKKHLINEENYKPKSSSATFSPHFDHNSPHFTTFSTPNDHIFQQNITDHNIYNCKYCNKDYSRIDALNRHILKSCKKKKEFDENERKKKEIIEKQEEIIKNQNNQLIKYENLIYNAKQINNTQNNDNSNNKTINNIHINNYGEENLEMLTDDFKKQCVRHPCSALIKIIERIHFNDDYPENRNIRLLNKRDNKVQVKDNGKWRYRSKQIALRDAIEDSNDKLEQFCDEKSNHFKKIIRLSCKEIIKTVQESDTELLKNLYKDLNIVLFNN